ncbi:beta-N-acetylhexosaminidase [Priestia aryabhattai]|uniref:beta-N-acetylhexosaminidase n=1 Tax=Priestia aryabhattai TaxID=412384 RepID=UPI001C8DACAC|nr:beta-N-acetylhexosaminidase [Priestia aryabhattai]MBY0063465.1 beta-N-acetylhexosaminidase [Priestia aryabhattai]
MKRVSKIALLFLMAILVITAVSSLALNTSKSKVASENVKGESSKKTTPKAAPNHKKQDSVTEKVNSLMTRMTLEEKIGQLMIIGFQSGEMDEHVQTMIKDYHVGGIILFDRNMKSPAQIAELNNHLQQLALKNQHHIPLLTSVDQEGGAITRMKDQVSYLPSQQELGKEKKAEQVYDTAYRSGNELAAMGFNLNFAPVLDLSNTDTRSFGKDPYLVNTYGNEVIKGLNDSGITATLKHFPGNGRSDIDPHKETSSVEANQLDLENSDIYPFKKTIHNVDNNRFFVMVTHIKYPAYDKVNPASLSPTIIQTLLREKLGYTGIVITDDLEMGAVNKYFTPREMGYKALKAGADILLVCHTLQTQEELFNGVVEAVQNHKLSEARIDEAVKRVLTYKLSAINSTYSDPELTERIVGKK